MQIEYGTSMWFVLSGDTMLTHWKKSLTGRRVKSTVQTTGNVVTENVTAENDIEMVVCKLCLSPCRAEQMYMLEQCRCSFCLEVIVMFCLVCPLTSLAWCCKV